MLRRFLLLSALLLTGCSDMTRQAKQKAYTPLVGPAPTPEDVVAFDARELKAPAVTMALLARGRERYMIYCAPCHAPIGDGKGMIVMRGFPSPPSYHTDRLRAAPPQHFYDVIAQGFGAMYSYAERVPAQDRWAIVAYIRELQRSQNAEIARQPERKP